MRCPHCDSRVTKKNKFCPGCGTEVIWEEKEKTQINGMNGNRALIAIGILLLIAVVVVGALVALGGAEGIKNIIAGNKTVAFSDDPEAISIASKSVIKLNCYDKNGDLYATGSGFACFEDNVIVTNYHVIQDNVYSIMASTEDGIRFEVSRVIVTDKERDIAIIATEKSHNLPLLEPANSNTLQKGEKVVAIGSPLGLLNTVSTGVFSGYTNENGMDVLQFTASISSGSSGGALFNDAGEVLGITFASYEAGQNLNLAIPMTQVERVWNNRKSTEMTVEEFYKSQILTYGIEEVVALGDRLAGREFYIQGVVYSHNVGQLGNGVWRGWCTVYPWTSNLPSKEESHSLENDPYGGIYIQIVEHTSTEKDNFVNKLRTGDWVKLRCVYDLAEPQQGRIVLTLVNVENIDR